MTEKKADISVTTVAIAALSTIAAAELVIIIVQKKSLFYFPADE